MLQLRPEQTEAMRQAALQQFEDEMVAHFQKKIPFLARVLKEDGLRKVVAYGMNKAFGHKLLTRGGVQLYLEMIIQLGAEFDNDPQYPWAKKILDDEQIDNEGEKVQTLFEKLTEYRDLIGGPNMKHVHAAIARVRQEPFAGPPLGNLPAYFRECKDRLARVHPEKCEHLGEEALNGLIQRSLAEAQQLKVTSDQGRALILGMMFTLGTGMTRDPHLPWIARTVQDDKLGDPNARMERLYTRAMTYLDRVLRNAPEEAADS